MLDRRVVASLVDRLSDLIAPLLGRFVFMNILRSDHTRRITGARRGNGIIERISKVILELDDRFRTKR